MSSPVSQESTRRRLTPQQAETVTKLTNAAVEVLDEGGFDGLTVREVAKRAGVAPATAYTYFSSKQHLVAEVFWRRLSEGLPAPDPTLPQAERVAAVLRDVSLVVAGEAQLGGAVTVALLGTDAEVEHLRLRVGAFIQSRISEAVGTDSPNAGSIVDTLEMLYAGALVYAGMGHLSYEQTSDRLVAAAQLVLGQSQA